MSQKYKVYFANRPVIYTQERPLPAELGVGKVVIDSKGKMDVLLIESAVAKGSRQMFMVCPNLDNSWRAFCDHFEFVQAAGGLVINPEGKMLFIFRHGKWDLPKGKVEEGESIEQGAIREVEEECSIRNLQVVQPLYTTRHTYIQKGDPILKATSWYVMSYLDSHVPKPQLEEGITEVRWLGWDDLDMVKSNTFPSVLDVIEAYRNIII